MAPASSHDSHNDLNHFDNSFDDLFNFEAATDGGIGPTEWACSVPHAASSLETSFIPRTTQVEDVSMRLNDHHLTHCDQGYLDDGDLLEASEGTSYNPGGSFDSWSNSHMNSNPLGDDFPGNYDQDSSEQLQNYTFNPTGPAPRPRDSNFPGFGNAISVLEYNIPEDFSIRTPQTTGSSPSPVSQTPVPSLDREAIAQRHVFIPLTEGQDRPRLMSTYPSIAIRGIYAVGTNSNSAQETNSQYTKALYTCLDLLEEPSLHVRLDSHGPIANADLYADHPNTTPPVENIPLPSNLVATSCFDNGHSTTSQLPQTLQTGSGCSGIRGKGVGSTGLTNPSYSKRRQNLPIRPAPEKSHPKVKHLARIQHVFGPEEAMPRRGDRSKLTSKGKKNAKEVRQNGGSCVVCMMKKQTCDIKEICDSCQGIALAKDPQLVAKHICIRGGILVFRQSFIDFYDTKNRLGLLLRTLRGPCRTIVIGGRVTTNGTESVIFPKKVPLIVQVREYQGSYPNMIWSDGSMRSTVASYAIDASTLPSASNLDQWKRNLLSECFELPELPNFRLPIMDEFLLTYLNTQPVLAYHHLVDLTIRLVNLSTWLFEAHPVTPFDNVNNPRSPVFNIHDDRIQRRLSEVARSQLLLIAAKDFEATEQQILSIIDAAMRPFRCNSQDALILGICLRRISLLYRFSFKRFPRVNNAKVIRKREKPKAMYEALGTAYSLVYCGNKNPFSIKWRAQDHVGALGNNIELFDLFLEVVEADKQYCQDNRDDEDDAHFNKLFLERKEGGGPRKWS